MRAVSPAGIPNAGTVGNSTPDDHFSTSPDCRVRASGSGRVDGVCGCPTICSGIVSSAGVESDVATTAISTPDDHFPAGPDCRVKVSGSGGVGCVGHCPAFSSRIVFPASVNAVKTGTDFTTPHNHFTTCPHRGVISPASWRVGCVSGGPTIRVGIVSSASVEIAAALTAPDDHFAASPDRRVMVSASGRIRGSRGYPTVRAGIVSPAAAQLAV